MTATDYNTKYVPIFAPDGFPNWCNDSILYSKPEHVTFTAGIRKIQETLRITQDGYCGPNTIDAIAREDYLRKKDKISGESGLITIGPKAYQVCVPVIHYFDDFTIGDTASRTRKEEIIQAVTHYDVSYNARATEKILENRGYSTHFIVDGDEEATIFQCHNATTKATFHAGSANEKSIGIDLNNPAALEYERGDIYRRNGRKRGSSHETVHNTNIQRLNYFPEQIDSYNALLDVLCIAVGIPRICPRDEQGEPIKAVVDDATEFKGIIGHYHLTKRKTDPSPLDWNKICPIIKQGE